MDETIDRINLDEVDEKDWFLIYHLAKLGALTTGISKTTQEIADSIGSTQQTISRRIKSLREQGLIDRVNLNDGIVLKLTPKANSLLRCIYTDLKNIMEKTKIEALFYGKVQKGMGEGAWYVSLPKYMNEFTEFLGSSPFPGTLNVQLDEYYINDYYYTLSQRKPRRIDGFQYNNRSFGPVNCFEVVISSKKDGNEEIKCLILDIRRTSHKKGTVELVSTFNLREKLGLEDGSTVGIRFCD